MRTEWPRVLVSWPGYRPHHAGLGRELFAPFRAAVGRAEEGAAVAGLR